MACGRMPPLAREGETCRPKPLVCDGVHQQGRRGARERLALLSVEDDVHVEPALPVFFRSTLCNPSASRSFVQPRVLSLPRGERLCVLRPGPSDMVRSFPVVGPKIVTQGTSLAPPAAAHAFRMRLAYTSMLSCPDLNLSLPSPPRGFPSTCRTPTRRPVRIQGIFSWKQAFLWILYVSFLRLSPDPRASTAYRVPRSSCPTGNAPQLPFRSTSWCRPLTARVMFESSFQLKPAMCASLPSSKALGRSVQPGRRYPGLAARFIPFTLCSATPPCPIFFSDERKKEPCFLPCSSGQGPRHGGPSPPPVQQTPSTCW